MAVSWIIICYIFFQLSKSLNGIPLELKGAGYDDPYQSRGMRIKLGNSYTQTSRSRGLHMVTFDLLNGQPSNYEYNRYDTFRRASYARNLQSAIDRLVNGRYVIGASSDEISRYISRADGGLRSLGINYRVIKYRTSIVFFARKGYPQQVLFAKRGQSLGPVELQFNLTADGQTGNEEQGCQDVRTFQSDYMNYFACNFWKGDFSATPENDLLAPAGRDLTQGYKVQLRGWGMDDSYYNRNGYIMVTQNTTLLSSTTVRYRGLTLVGLTLSPEGGINFLDASQYVRHDVYGGTYSARRFKTYLKSLPHGAFLLGASADEISRNLYVAREPLAEFGICFESIGFRESIVFVARKGFPSRLEFALKTQSHGPTLLESRIFHESGGYLVAKQSGTCASDSKRGNGFVFMKTDSDCRLTDGLVGTDNKASPLPSLTACYFDWCSFVQNNDSSSMMLHQPTFCNSTKKAQAGLPTSQTTCDQTAGVYDNGSLICWLELCPLQEFDSTTFVIDKDYGCPAMQIGGDTNVTMTSSLCAQPEAEVNTSLCHPGNETCTTQAPTVSPGDGYYTCTMQICKMERDCKKTDLGNEYKGSWSKTLSRKACQRWDSVPLFYTDPDSKSLFPDSTLQSTNNYCRNPTDAIQGLWCVSADGSQEFCDIPFCKGYGPQILDFHLDETRYIVVPGSHGDPRTYCRERYGASMLILETEKERQNVVNYLQNAKYVQKEGEGFWLAEKTNEPENTTLNAASDILDIGDSLECVRLVMSSNGSLQLISKDCPEDFHTFICEVTHVVIPEMLLENIPSSTYTTEYDLDLETCSRTCLDPCGAIAYQAGSHRCYKINRDTVCSPAPIHTVRHYSAQDTIQHNTVHIRKTNCGCNVRLVTGAHGVDDSAMTASSVFEEDMTSDTFQMPYESYGAMAGRIYIAPDASISGSTAWVAAVNDTNPWIQVEFPEIRGVYAIMTAHLNQTDSAMWTTMYKISFSLDCQNWQLYLINDMIGSRYTPRIDVDRLSSIEHRYQLSILNLKSVHRAKCVRVSPDQWTGAAAAFRFDLIGCVDSSPNIALDKQVYNSWRYTSTHYRHFYVDGFRDVACNSYHSTQELVIDLGEFYQVQEVAVFSIPSYSRRAIDVSLLSSLYVTNRRINSSGAISCGQIPPEGSSRAINCESDVPPVGRFILLRSVYSSIYLCEVEVIGEKVKDRINLALNKPSQQSSNYIRPSYSYSYSYTTQAPPEPNPGLVVDGNTKTEYLLCIITELETSPWWTVDLLLEYDISDVIITFNLRTEYSAYPKNISVMVTSSKFPETTDSKMHLCSNTTLSNPEFPETHNLQCHENTRGRYIVVKMEGNGQLELCEVQVYGQLAVTKTYGGNGGGAPCAMPFIYKGINYTTCIIGGQSHSWCPITHNYDLDGKWGYCQDVRLVGGRAENEGRVEIRLPNNPDWGTVCDDGWDDVDADTACKQLGYKGGVAKYQPEFGPGAGPILLQSVACKGNEIGLIHCEYALDHTCSHREDAGVRCYTDSDDFELYGYPTFPRSHYDTWESGIIIVQIDKGITIAGGVSSWNIYTPELFTSSITFQIWRPTKDVTKFILVGQNIASDIQLENHVVRNISKAEQIKVLPGDLIGVQFEGAVPMTFDYTHKCSKTKIFIHNQSSNDTDSGSIEKGTVMEFKEKDDGDSCKIFSFFARITKTEPFITPTVLYGGVAYKVVKDDMVPKSKVDNICRFQLGVNGSLADLSEKAVFGAVGSELTKQNVTGQFWVKGNPLDGKVRSWKPCEPDADRNCLVISRDVVTDSQFMWEAMICENRHYLLCQVQKGIGIKDINQVHSMPTRIGRLSDSPSSAALAIMLVILFILIILVSVGGVMLYRRRTKEIDLPKLPVLPLEETEMYGNTS